MNHTDHASTSEIKELLPLTSKATRENLSNFSENLGPQTRNNDNFEELSMNLADYSSTNEIQ